MSLDDIEKRNLHLPRILALHGGGVTAEIYRLQSRALIRALEPHFRLVFPDAPYTCDPGPNILPVYDNMGPYRRWTRFKRDGTHAEVTDEAAMRDIEGCIKKAIEDDNRKGADGDFIAIMGFSQGAKIAASILFDTQKRMEAARDGGTDGMYGGWEERNLEGYAGGHWRFAICMAGRPAFVSLTELTLGMEGIDRPGALPIQIYPGMDVVSEKLKLPTIHVHGVEDDGLEYHKLLLEHCDRSTAKLMEWGGDHRVPLQSPDVHRLVDLILKTAKETGALPKEHVNRHRRSSSVQENAGGFTVEVAAH